MTEDRTSLASIYTGWNVYQQHLVKAIAPLTPELLALPASPNHRSKCRHKK